MQAGHQRTWNSVVGGEEHVPYLHVTCYHNVPSITIRVFHAVSRLGYIRNYLKYSYVPTYSVGHPSKLRLPGQDYHFPILSLKIIYVSVTWEQAVCEMTR